MRFRSLSFPTVSHPASPNYIKLTASEAEKRKAMPRRNWVEHTEMVNY